MCIVPVSEDMMNWIYCSCDDCKRKIGTKIDSSLKHGNIYVVHDVMEQYRLKYKGFASNKPFSSLSKNAIQHLYTQLPLDEIPWEYVSEGKTKYIISWIKSNRETEFGERLRYTIKWHSNGEPKSIESFLLDKKHGYHIKLYENGIMKRIELYSLGNKEGIDSAWYNDGERKHICYYTNNELNGPCSLYDKTGIVKDQCRFNCGKRV